MKKILFVNLFLVLTFIHIPNSNAECLAWNDHGNCIQEEAAPTEDAQWQTIRQEFENDPQYGSVRYQVDSNVYTYSPEQRKLLLDQWATNTLRQRANDAARNQVEQQVITQAQANPGQEVCGTWSVGNQSGGVCTTVPITAKKIDDTQAQQKIAEIRAQLEKDPQYQVLRYGIGNQTFDYSSSERAALLDQWAINMAGNELAKIAASKKAEKNPGARVCSQWSIAGQNGEVCDYVPVALTSKKILENINFQIAELEIDEAQSKKINKHVKLVDSKVPDQTFAKSIKLPKAPKGMSQSIAVLNPDDCSIKGRKVTLKKGEMCEINITLTINEETNLNFGQTITRT